MDLPERINKVDVVRQEGGKIHVFRKIPTSFSKYTLMGNLNHTIHDANSGEIIEENSSKYSQFIGNAHLTNKMDKASMGFVSSMMGITIGWNVYSPVFVPWIFSRLIDPWAGIRNEEYFSKVREFKEKNMADLEKAIKDIRIYQGTKDEVSKELETGLERVDTGKPETYLTSNNPFWLRVRAHELGADAVIHCQPGSSIGTPVKYKN